MDDEQEYGYPEQPGITPGKVIKFILKFIAIGLIVLVYALLFWRIYTSKTPKNIKKFLFTQDAFDVCSSSPDSVSFWTRGDGTVWSFTPDRPEDSDGSFTAEGILYADGLSILEMTIRYNNSTVKYLTEDYRLDEKPQGEPFIFILEDNAGNTYSDYVYAPFARSLYNYRRLIFKNVDLTDVTSLRLNVYYVGDVSLSSPYRYLDVYSTAQPISAFPEKGKYMTYTATEEFTTAQDPAGEAEEKSYTEYLIYPFQSYDASGDLKAGVYSDLREPVSYLVKD